MHSLHLQAILMRQPHDPDLNRITTHLPFNRLLECQQRNMYRILQLQILRISLLQKRLRARRTLANRRRLPRKVTPRRIDLIERRTTFQDSAGLTRRWFARLTSVFINIHVRRLCRAGNGSISFFRRALTDGLNKRLNAFIPTRNEQTDTIWPHTSRLRGFLHNLCHVLHQNARGWVLVVDAFVLCVGDFAGFVDEEAVVGAHAGVDHADVWGDEGDFGGGGGVEVDERGGGFLFGGDDDAVCCWEGEFVSWSVLRQMNCESMYL